MGRTSERNTLNRILQESGIGKEQLEVLGKVYALEKKSDVRIHFSAGDQSIRCDSRIGHSYCAQVILEGEEFKDLTSKPKIRKYLGLKGILEVDAVGFTIMSDAITPYAIKDRICLIFSRPPF